MRFCSLIRCGAVLLSGAVWMCCSAPATLADEIRVVDARGLVRAVKITHGSVRLVVTLGSENRTLPTGECIATNVDGLAAEKRVTVSSKGECVFSEVSGGSWQISVPQGFSWRVQVYE